MPRGHQWRDAGVINRRTPACLANRTASQANILIYCKVYGEPCWVRTSDLLIKSQLLYRLS